MTTDRIRLPRTPPPPSTPDAQYRAMVASRIRSARLARKLTQTALGATLGVTDAAIANWEAGRCLPRGRFHGPLAAALGTDVAHLFVHGVPR